MPGYFVPPHLGQRCTPGAVRPSTPWQCRRCRRHAARGRRSCALKTGASPRSNGGAPTPPRAAACWSGPAMRDDQRRRRCDLRRAHLRFAARHLRGDRVQGAHGGKPQPQWDLDDDLTRSSATARVLATSRRPRRRTSGLVPPRTCRTCKTLVVDGWAAWSRHGRSPLSAQ
jgi:hypothetical protein